ncbi:O-antigen ligase family protein [Winogradskyella sp.]|uniref:O-antigen ligase family protein n=1 Tax=Winogradskyella sp. TaxID=1883156 RepID=UPI0038670EBE
MNVLKWVFVISLSFFLLTTFTYFFLTEPFYTFKSTIVHYHTLIDLRIKGYEIHSIYLSMYIGVGIIFLLDIIAKTNRSKRVYGLILIVLLFIFFAVLNKRGPVISLGMIGVVFIIKSKFKGKLAWSIVALSIMFVITLISIPKFNNVNRFKELIDIQGLKANPNSSTALRLTIYDCALQQAAKAPIFGYGWGDVKGILIECYREENQNLLLKNYNSHNQFLSMLLATGVIGLLIFLLYFYYILKFSNKNKNQVLFFLLLYFAFNMLSENILEREDGVIFFSFFVNLFLFNSEVKLNDIQEK